jgi:hypothetical protein
VRCTSVTSRTSSNQVWRDYNPHSGLHSHISCAAVRTEGPAASEDTWEGVTGPAIRIACCDLPEVDAVYVREHQDHYVARSGPNALLKHPVEDVWCVTNGDFFILMATEVAADPTAVKQWTVRIKNIMVPTSSIVVAHT